MARVKAFHKCTDFPLDPIIEVTLDVETGSAWFGDPKELAWFAIYRPCCSFYEDKDCTKQIKTEGITPVLDLTV